MATINALSASYTDVNNAITEAAVDDVVVIPAGDETWETNLGVTKRVEIRGAPNYGTIIRRTLPNNNTFWGWSNNITANVHDIRFVMAVTSNSSYVLGLRGLANVIGRIKVECTGAKTVAVRASGGTSNVHPTGVVYSCDFVNARCHVQGDLGTGSGQMLGRRIWADLDSVIGYGDANTMVFESNTFDLTTTSGNVIDAEYGGHYVFRHNTIYNGTAFAHGVTSFGERGTRKVEIYENTFNLREDHTPQGRAVTVRGGSGVVYNNTFVGAWGSIPMSFSLEGTRNQYGGDSATVFTAVSTINGDGDAHAGKLIYNLTDGSKGTITASTSTTATVAELTGGSDNTFQNNDICLIWPVDEDPLLDQIGRGVDAEYWVVDAWPRPVQALEPLYEWGNYHAAARVTFQYENHYGFRLQEGRDWYENTTKPGYTPYTYPHPLRDNLPPPNPARAYGKSVFALGGLSF